MNRKAVCLLFCVLGVVLPYWQFVPWLAEHGLPLALFVRELFANRIGGFFGMDVLVSAVVLISFVQREGKRLGMRASVIWERMSVQDVHELRQIKSRLAVIKLLSDHNELPAGSDLHRWLGVQSQMP